MNKDKIALIDQLTPMQNGMLFHSILDENSISYHQQVCFFMHGNISIETIKRSWQEIVNRHETFRTDFLWQKVKTPIQVVLKQREAEIYEYDISNLGETEKQEYLEQFKDQDMNQAFDFEKGKSYRFSIIKLSPKKCFIVFAFHHILLDGWSVQIVIGEFFKLYQAYAKNLPVPKNDQGTYKEYLKWLKTRNTAKGLEFWQSYMQSLQKQTLVCTQSQENSFNGVQQPNTYKMELAKEKAEKIADFCKENKITINALFQSAWGLLLQKHNNTHISCAGMTVSGRPAEVPQMQNMVGLFINTVPIVINSQERNSFRDLLMGVNQDLGTIKEYEYISLGDIKKCTNFDKESDLFDSILIFQNFPLADVAKQVEWDFEIEFDSSFELTNYDLSLTISGRRDLQVKAVHNLDKISTERVGLICQQLVNIIDTIIQNPDGQVAELVVSVDDPKVELVSGLQAEKEYWLNKLGGDLEESNLPLDYQRTNNTSIEKTVMKMMLSEELSSKVYDFTKNDQMKLFTLLMTALNIGVYKYSNHSDIIVGTTLLKDEEGKWNQLFAIRDQVKPELGIQDFMAQVEQSIAEAYQNQKYSFDELLTTLDVIQEPSRMPLFDIILALDQLHDFQSLQGLNNDLSFLVTEDQDQLAVTIEYKSSLYRNSTIEQFYRHVLTIVERIVTQKEQQISEIDILSDSEKNQLINDFNHTYADFPLEKTLHQIFEEQVEVRPDQVAVEYLDQRLTYQELNAQANAVAAYLRDAGLQPNNIVGLVVPRSLEMMIGILGILKAGGTYLPIDPDYPEDRITYMLNDSQAKFVLTNASLADQIICDGTVVNIEESNLFTADTGNLEHVNQSTDMAYIIYTSGSTGTPKGVMIEHRNAVNVLTALAQMYPLTERDAYLLKTAYTFDVSVSELFGWFFGQGKLVILENDAEKEPKQIIQTIEEKQITHINFVPSMLNILIHSIEPQEARILNQLKYIFVAGEAISRELVEEVKELAPDIIFENLYGPTEATIYATQYSLKQLEKKSNVPIGRPLPNVETYIINEANQLQPIGVPGELCISGTGIARGYLNRPNLTSEKFISHPFREERILYRTGDIARWLPDGNIEYLGRIDHQVKIRGYRIELGEIKAQLLQYEGLQEAIVLDLIDEHKNKYLCAYIVADRQMMITELRKFLAQKLSDYMIPTRFVQLDQMPVTSSGKINRRAFPKPETVIETQTEYVAPRNEKEEKMVQIWQEVLGVKKIGVLDNFFEVGGDSIKAIQILSRAKIHEINTSVKGIFKYKTIAQIIKNLDQNKDVVIIEQSEVKGEVLLTPVQNWFFEQKFKYPNYWNQVNIFKLQDDVNIQLLEKVFKEIITHHDALRMGYQVKEDQIVQLNRGLDEVQFQLGQVNLADLPEERQQQEIIQISEDRQNQADLENDLLIKVIVFDLGQNGKRLFIGIHHLIIDGVSWRILLEDINYLYNSSLESKLPAKTTSFKEWSHRLTDLAQTNYLNLKYWEDIDASQIQPIADQALTEELQPKDYKKLQVKIDRQHTDLLLSKVYKTYNTEINDLLLAAFCMTVTDVMEKERILFTLEGHGREELWGDVDLSRTIGWFTSMFPVYYQKQTSIADSLKFVKESLRRIRNKGLDYGVGRYLQKKPKLISLNSQIIFNYLGQIDGIITEEKTGLLTGSPEKAGRSSHPLNQEQNALMNINGYVLDGQLQFIVSYNSKYLYTELMEQFQSGFENNLQEVIDHCQSRQGQTFTASDFGVGELFDINGFDELLACYDEETVGKLKIYGLTPLQDGMLFHSIYNEKGTNYFEQVGYYLEGWIDLDLIKKTWKQVINHHEIFKTDFRWKESNRPVQVIVPYKEPEIIIEDISHLDVAAQQKYISEFKVADLGKGFDFERGKLNRLSLVKLTEQKYFTCWTFHHILLDGWSIPIVLKDFVDLYLSRLRQSHLSLKPVAQFSDYLEWLREQDMVKGQEFWRDYMKEVQEPTLLLGAGNTTKDRDLFDATKVEYEFDQNLTQKIAEFCRKQNITVNSLIQTLWGILLQKYNNTQNSCFGMTVSGRPTEISDVEQIVGLFINTLPVVVNTTDTDQISSLLAKVNKELVEIREYEYLSLPDIKELSPIDNSQEMFNTLIVFENYPVQSALNQQNSYITVSYESRFEMPTYDLSMAVISRENTVFRIVYNQELFDSTMVEQIFSHFSHLIHLILENPEMRISEIDLVSETEKEKLLYTWNDTEEEYSKGQVITQMFEERVEENPEAIALVYQGMTLTRKELNEKANQLARILQAKGVQSSKIVGIMADRSLEMVVGILGVLKAGGAYLPIDAEYPTQRIQYLLNDSQTEILLTTKPLTEEIKFPGQVIDLTDQQLYIGDHSNLPTVLQPTDLAYIIYTSGSTGNPKGVMIEHRGLMNLIMYWKQEIKVSPDDRILQFASSAFDASVTEFFVALGCSARLYLVTKDVINDYNKMSNYLRENEITIATFPPIYLNNLNPEKVTSLQKVITAGSATNFALVNRWKDHVTYFNAYGPTETTVCTSVWSFDELDYKYSNVPIGTPIYNTKVYILDQYDKLAPVGVIGELCVSGDGLARGYLNRPELNDQKFVINPYTNERMYRTGDLARWLPDEKIEFLGRIDTQVKVRGFRIELGEIESYLLKHEKIKEIVVTTRQDINNGSELIAYYVADQELAISQLRNYLLANLPDYMVPSYFVKIDSIPLTHNGKVNYKQLLIPHNESVSNTRYVAPETHVEKVLAQIWSDVLRVEKVGVYDNFFDLGGHSLKATSLVTKVNRELGVDLPLREIFKTPTIKGQAELIQMLDLSQYHEIKKAPDSSYYPLSSAQRRLFVLNQMDQDDLSYNIPNAVRISEKLDVARFEKAMEQMVSRHELLRTSFDVLNDEPVQIIHEEIQLPIHYFKVKEDAVQATIREFIRPFNLSQVPLFRIALIEVGQENILVFNMHHSITDGISMGILIQEFAQLYQGQELPALQLNYKDYAVWQQDFFKTKEFKEQEKYWLDLFSTKPPTLDLPTDYSRINSLDYAGAKFKFSLDLSTTKKLKDLASSNEATLYMTLLSVYNVLLLKYTGQEDITVGTPIAGRFHPSLENILGMFVNTLVMRNFPQMDERFVDFLQDVKKRALQAFENQDYQFEMLVNSLNLERDVVRNPLFDTMLTLENYAQDDTQMDSLQVTPYPFENKVSQFDLTLSGIESNEGIHFIIEYRTGLFKQETIERISEHFINIVQSVIVNPEQKIADIKLLSPEEEKLLIQDFNQNQIGYPDEKTIHQLLQEQARRNPDKVAVTFKDQSLTYRELDEKTNQLARVLVSKGVQKESIVGVMCEPSLEALIGFIGVLKAGGAYMPIDPQYPQQRIMYMLEDSQIKILLTQEHLKDQVEFAGQVVILTAEDLYTGDATQMVYDVQPDNLAYIIYTSGSTGAPKGVMVEHRNVVAYIHAFQAEFKLTPQDVMLQQASYSFDASVEEMYPILNAGGRLVILEKEKGISIDSMMKVINQEKVSLLSASPLVINEINKLEILPSIRVFISGGDELKKNYVTSLIKYAKVYNTYGPTEATVCATYYQCDDQLQENIPIGKPIANYVVRIVDRYGHMLPIGVFGELCIAGSGVTRGYLNRPDLTKEKFVPDPCNPDGFMYKSGDLARWLPDGNIEFVGRIDQQVNIRGYRIELGEIEAQLSDYPKIREAIVLVKEDQDGSKHLRAYIVTTDEMIVSEIRDYLSIHLPGYMLPTYFIEIDDIPLITNGKVDRKALLAVDSTMITGKDYFAPTTELEKHIASVWTKVLRIEKVNLKDSFFEIGGDSIKALQIVSLLKEQGYHVRLKEFFSHSTLKEFAKRVKTGVVEQGEQGLLQGDVILAPIQQITKEIMPDLKHFSAPVLFKFKEKLDLSALETAIRYLIEYHDGLRLNFNSEIDQLYYNNKHIEEPFKLKVINLSDLSPKKQDKQLVEYGTQLMSSYDWENELLLKIMVFDLGERGQRMLFAPHQMIIDPISRSILIQDLVHIYCQLIEGKTVQLLPKSTSFKKWTEILYEYSSSNTLLEEKIYWDKISQTSFVLPKDFEKGPNFMKDYLKVLDSLNEEETKLLLTQVNKAFASETEDILLAALSMTVHDLTDQSEVMIELQGHGREDIFEGIDLSRTVGLFTTMFPVKLETYGCNSKVEVIQRVKDQLHNIPNKGIGYGVLKTMSDEALTEIDPTNLIRFEYLGQLDSDIQQNSLLEIAPEYYGEKSSQHNSIKGPITISSYVINYKLRIVFNYSRTKFNQETIEKMLDVYISNLKEIIRYCQN